MIERLNYLPHVSHKYLLSSSLLYSRFTFLFILLMGMLLSKIGSVRNLEDHTLLGNGILSTNNHSVCFLTEYKYIFLPNLFKFISILSLLLLELLLVISSWSCFGNTLQV